ncbi:uncharacterized protein LOC144704997 [Wolffia australiana]
MKERVRNREISSSSSKIEQKLHKFLRPGALARLRDSKRRSFSIPKVTISEEDVSSPILDPENSVIVPAMPREDCFPRFLTGLSGPVCPLRKKLVAAKAMVLVPSSPARPSASDLAGLGVFNPNMLFAH